MADLLMVNPQTAAVEWAKGRAALSALHGGRVATRLPKAPVLPFLQVFGVAGGIDGSQAPLGQHVLQWDCWAKRQNDAWLLAQALVDELISASGVATSDAFIYGFRITAGPTPVAPGRSLAGRVQGQLGKQEPGGLERWQIDSLVSIRGR